MEVVKGAKMFPFERLEVWKKSVIFAEAVLNFADNIDIKDSFLLGEQIRRTIVSVSNNIAEGGGRTNNEHICKQESRFPYDPW